ncbi:protein phosphatase 2C domain-containing protein [Streptomyces sp. NPDC047046]|uniref:MerR family transcriptional regulator n=1 Tax=Streptomyces sp. NPDC047046 TaxID=3155378 RepID=UPI0033E9BAD5
MSLLPIGEFARVSRLSAKALRLYDRMGLVVPAWVDPVTGYRYYAGAQVERARLVGWLRRVGMPLARVGEVVAMEPGAAAEAVRGWWGGVEAETAVRGALAAFVADSLADSLAGPPPGPAFGLRFAGVSDRGLVREENQDAVHAGERLLAVADGFGARGALASGAAVAALRRFSEGPEPAPGALLGALADAVDEAARKVPAQAGTTLTALLPAGSRLALVHVGDTRAYLLRDGALRRLTHDHTLVQALADEGRITEREAATHPQRATLVRALTPPAARPDLQLRTPRTGDRYLVCSDGLTAAVPEPAIRRTLRETATDPARAARALVSLAHRAGGPDNVSCVVADVGAG